VLSDVRFLSKDNIINLAIPISVPTFNHRRRYHLWLHRLVSCEWGYSQTAIVDPAREHNPSEMDSCHRYHRYQHKLSSHHSIMDCLPVPPAVCICRLLFCGECVSRLKYGQSDAVSDLKPKRIPTYRPEKLEYSRLMMLEDINKAFLEFGTISGWTREIQGSDVFCAI
jgi:hypothetical protein